MDKPGYIVQLISSGSPSVIFNFLELRISSRKIFFIPVFDQSRRRKKFRSVIVRHPCYMYFAFAIMLSVSRVSKARSSYAGKSVSNSVPRPGKPRAAGPRNPRADTNAAMTHAALTVIPQWLAGIWTAQVTASGSIGTSCIISFCDQPTDILSSQFTAPAPIVY